MLDADTGRGGASVGMAPRDGWGYSWITARQAPHDILVLGDDLRIEQDLTRWFAVWGAPGV